MCHISTTAIAFANQKATDHHHHHHHRTLASAKVSSDLVVTRVLGAAATMVGALEEAAAEARVEATTAGAMKAELGSAERRHAAVVTAREIARPPENSIFLACCVCDGYRSQERSCSALCASGEKRRTRVKRLFLSGSVLRVHRISQSRRVFDETYHSELLYIPKYASGHDLCHYPSTRPLARAPTLPPNSRRVRLPVDRTESIVYPGRDEANESNNTITPPGPDPKGRQQRQRGSRPQRYAWGP